MAFIAVAVGAASVGMSIYGAVSAPGAPQYPDQAASAAELTNVNARLLPIQRGMAAAQQTGGKYSFWSPVGVDPSVFTNAGLKQDQQEVQVPADGVAGSVFGEKQWVPYNTADFAAGGKYASIKNPTVRGSGPFTADFTGKGQGDVQTAVANATAKNSLATAQKFDPQFIASSLNQEKLADPQSFAARDQMSKLVQDQINRPINSPVSDLMNSQVQESLDAANKNSLTGLDTQRLDAAVASAQRARGDGTTPGDFAQPLTSGFAGEARQAGAAAGAIKFLASGSSPEDIAYRREQQNLGNLSAEVNGKTPQSQFASLSGAQSGPTPMATAAALPVMPQGQDAAAQAAAMANWNTQMRSQQNQVNPWMLGLSTAINGASVAGGAGWKPFGTS